MIRTLFIAFWAVVFVAALAAADQLPGGGLMRVLTDGTFITGTGKTGDPVTISSQIPRGTGVSGDLTAWTGTSAVGNFAGSSPTACAAGQVLTRVTSAATGAITLTCTAIGTAGGITGSALTTNVIPKATGATSIGNSTISDPGTGTVTTSSQFSIARAAGSTPLLDFQQVGQTEWQFYGHASANTFSLWNSGVFSDVTTWDNAGNIATIGAVQASGAGTFSALATIAGHVDVFGTDAHTILNWTGSTTQDSYIRAGKFAGAVNIGDVNTGGVNIGAASNTTTINGPLTSIAGPNTLGETEDNMTTASNSSGTLTDVSFDRHARGVWWTITGGLTVDGFGFTSGTPTDGQKFKICLIGGGSLVAPHENSGETTAGRRFNFQINAQQVLRSGGCWDFTYEDAGGVGGKRWHRSENGIASFNSTVNTIPKYTGNYELQSSTLQDNGTTVSTTEPLSTSSTLSACTGCVQTSSIGANTTLSAGSTAGTITLGTGNTGGITIGQNTNTIALNGQTTSTYSAAAATVDKDSFDISNTSTWNTTAAAHNTYGVHAVCNNSISAGANTLTTSCGYFSNTSSGANINAWALVTDTGDVRLNNTSGGTTAHGAFSVDGTTTLNGTLSALAAATLSGGVTVNTGTLTVNSSESLNGNLVDSDLTHITDKDGTNRPTIANCGTTAPTVVGTDTSGFFTTATGVASTCAITFHTAYSSNVDCKAWTTGANGVATAEGLIGLLTISTSGLTFNGSSGPLAVGVKVHWECKDH